MSSPDRKHPPKNANVGDVACPTCESTAYVRRKTSGKYYVNCPHCGLFNISYRSGQEWILSNARFYGPNGEHSAESPFRREPTRKQLSTSPPSFEPMRSEPDPEASKTVSAGTPPNVPETPSAPKPTQAPTPPEVQQAAPTPQPTTKRKLSDLLL